MATLKSTQLSKKSGSTCSYYLGIPGA